MNHQTQEEKFILLNDFNIDWIHALNILWLPICIQSAAVIIGMVINRIINRKLRTNLAANPETLQYVFINALKGLPISWCSGVGLYWTITTLSMTPGLKLFLTNILFAVILFTLTRVIARTLVGMIDMHTLKNENMPKTSLLSNIVNIFIYAMGTLVLLQSYGISVAPILTALGVGGMAVALALQDTLSNIFSGIYLILSRQIRLGDYIRLSSGEEGSVTDITWRFTTIQSSGKNVIVVPNKHISSTILTNYNMPKPEIAIVIPVSVSYDSDLDHVERVTIEVAKEVMQTLEENLELEPAIRFHTLNESSIDFNVILHSSQFLNQYLLKHEFIKALIKRYREENITIPYPIRTILNSEKS